MSTGAVPIQMPVRRFGLSTGSFHFPARYARFGDFDLDLDRQELYRGGIRIKLQTKVFEALLVLLEAPGDVVGREGIRQKLWPEDSVVNFDANVNTTVNKLRQVLGDSPDEPVYVQTIPRKGYSFVAAIEYLDQPAPQQNQEPEEKSSAAAESLSGESKSSLLRAAFSSRWFTAGVISLVLAGMLFGAALMLYSHRGI